jgi:aspartate carbamoyltransferase catalytic subunit
VSLTSQAEDELATVPRVGIGPHVLSIADLGAEGIAEVLRVALAFAEVERRSIPKVPTLRGKVVATLFFEESTRTRLSFETAAKRLSADVLSLAVASSAVQKGESLRDTVETIEALGIDAVVLRHRSSGAPEQVARWVKRAHVVNAGDGWHEHPTQALVDCFTVRQMLAETTGVEPASLGVTCFEGRRVVIVGDVRHSRVARSEVLAYSALGAQVVLAGPSSLMPASLEGWPVTVAEDLDEVLGTADVVSLLRLQAERGSGAFVPSLREYTADAPPRSRRDRDPSRTDGAGGRDRLRCGRPAQHGGDPAGHQRGRRAHGRVVPPPRCGQRAGGSRKHPWLRPLRPS